jgi:hypothetical protein
LAHVIVVVGIAALDHCHRLGEVATGCMRTFSTDYAGQLLALLLAVRSVHWRAGLPVRLNKV